MSDAIAVVISLAIVVGMASGILLLLDRVTLRSDLSVEEGKAKVREQTARWQRRWGTFYLIAAVIALVLNGLNLNHESLRSRIGWSVPAAIVVSLFLLSKSTADKDPE